MKKYKFNPEKGNINKIKPETLEENLNKALSMLEEISKFDFSDSKKLKNSEKFTNNLESKIKKLEKNIEKELGDFLEEDLDTKK